MDYLIYLCQITFGFAVAEVKSLPQSTKTLEGSLRVKGITPYKAAPLIITIYITIV